MKSLKKIVFASLLSGLLPAWVPEAFGAEPSHTALRIKNPFERPEQVLDHFLARDSEGFVWSGLLDRERTEFTTWKDVPRRDAYYLADSLKVTPVGKPTSDRAEFLVRYSGVVQVDAAGTLVPVDPPSLEVSFVLLKRESKPWRISSPESDRFVPVLLRKRD